MSKKRNSKSVIITVFITLIVLAGLTYAGVKYLLPIYAQGQDGALDMQRKVYEFSVKIFPLIIGIVLIVIASMIATSRDDDEEDEEDKLPPNSYDKQLFEEPNDDPVITEEAPAVEEVAPEEKAEFVSIFDTPTEPEQEVAPVEEPAPVAEEPEAVAEEPAPVVEEPKQESKQDLLVDAIYALVDKLDEMTDLYEYDDDEDFDDDFEEEPEEEPKPEEPVQEDKVDKLCDAIASLVDAMQTKPVAAEPVVVEKPVEVEKIVEKPVEVEKVVEKIVEKPVEIERVVEVEKLLDDSDVTDPLQRARIELDSAKESNYDISFATVYTGIGDVQLSLGEFCDSFDIKGRTAVIIPFMKEDDVRTELDKIGAPYKMKTIAAGEDVDFDSTVAPFFS